MSLFRRAAIALFATVMATSASASIVGFNAAEVKIIPAPALVNNNTPGDNDFLLAFNEAQSVTLGAALTTDQGTIAAGTLVDSHMVFLNRSDRKTGNANLISVDTEIQFGGTVLGTMSDQNGGLRMVPSDFLGGPVTTYANFNNRGLEQTNCGVNCDFVTFALGSDTVRFDLHVTQPGDWVRVVTVAAVPTPAAFAMMGTGLAAFAVMRRRRRKAA